MKDFLTVNGFSINGTECTGTLTLGGESLTVGYVGVADKGFRVYPVSVDGGLTRHMTEFTVISTVCEFLHKHS